MNAPHPGTQPTVQDLEGELEANQMAADILRAHVLGGQAALAANLPEAQREHLKHESSILAEAAGILDRRGRSMQVFLERVKAASAVAAGTCCVECQTGATDCPAGT